MQNSEQILLSLQALKPSELEQVRARTLALLSRPRERLEYEMVHRHAQTLMKQATGVELPPYHVCAKTMANFDDFRGGVDVLLKFIAKHLKPKTRAELSGAVFLVLRVLIGRMQELDVPVGYRTLTQALHRTAVEVDAAFPGYVRSGLLPCILSAANSGRIGRV